MDDISGKISEILGSPEKLSQAMQLAGELMERSTSEPQPAVQPSAARPNDCSAPGDLLSVLSSVDPKLLGALTGVLSALGHDDSKIALLHALRPHIRGERAERIDRAIQILRISCAVRAALASLKGGNDHVLQI